MGRVLASDPRLLAQEPCHLFSCELSTAGESRRLISLDVRARMTRIESPYCTSLCHAFLASGWRIQAPTWLPSFDLSLQRFVGSPPPGAQGCSRSAALPGKPRARAGLVPASGGPGDALNAGASPWKVRNHLAVLAGSSFSNGIRMPLKRFQPDRSPCTSCRTFTQSSSAAALGTPLSMKS